MNGLLSRKENGAAGAGNTDLILPVRVRTCAEDVGRTGDRLVWFPGMQQGVPVMGVTKRPAQRYFAGRRVGRSWRASFHPVGEAWDRAPARSPERNNTVTLSPVTLVRGAIMWRQWSDRMKSHAVSASSAIYKATPKGRLVRRIREAVSGSTDS
jgi:hypothetical protein